MSKKKREITKKEVQAMKENPELFDEETIGGSMPNPESDDDTLEGVQEWGLYENSDQEHLQELDLPKEVDKAEKTRRRKRRE
ncbi:MAG: hypothetical protein M1514_01820 [Patescibacteria group bacterium]|nr:hypothetical protein [Patescibacteria group bacterium]